MTDDILSIVLQCCMVPHCRAATAAVIFQSPPKPKMVSEPTARRSIGIGGQHVKVCHSCMFACRTMNQYKAHMEGHWQETKACADCGVHVKSGVYFKQHLRLHIEVR